jgi:hypothetical protein
MGAAFGHKEEMSLTTGISIIIPGGYANSRRRAF